MFPCMITDVRFVQFLKTHDPILQLLFGKDTSFYPVQFSNAEAPKTSNFDGHTMFFKLTQL